MSDLKIYIYIFILRIVNFYSPCMWQRLKCRKNLHFFSATLCLLHLGNYSRREGARGSSWSAQSTPRGTYNESRGGQSNFNRGPLPPLRPLSSAGIYGLIFVIH